MLETCMRQQVISNMLFTRQIDGNKSSWTLAYMLECCWITCRGIYVSGSGERVFRMVTGNIWRAMQLMILYKYQSNACCMPRKKMYI